MKKLQLEKNNMSGSYRKATVKSHLLSGPCRIFPSHGILSVLRTCELRGNPSKSVTRSCIIPGLFLLSLLTISNVSALTYESDTNVDFTINPTISMTVSGNLIINNLAPGSSSDSNIIEVGVSTNASHGYYLSATVGSSNTNTNLTHSENSNYKFTSLSSNASSLSNFSDNQWGYSYSTDGGANWVSGSQGSTASGYNGLPLDGNDSGATGITLIDTTAPLATSQVKFKIGAKASNTQASGTYTNTINFYVIAHQAPLTFDDAFAAAGKTKYLGYYTMQDISSSICQAVEQNFTTKLIDVRDNNIYNIAKINGQCWMTQNLRTTGIISAQYSNFTGADFNVSLYDLATNGAADGPCNDPNGLSNPCSKSSSGTSDNGSWYNYCAATAGKICSNNNSANSVQDICPTNWHLPTGPSAIENTDFNRLIGNTFPTDQDPTSGLTSFHATVGGIYYNGTLYDPGYGYWWSATAYNFTHNYYLVYNQNNTQFNGNAVNSRLVGYFIRCVTYE